MYLVKQVPKNTDSVVSGLILTKVLLNGIVLMPFVITIGIELYLVRQIPENTD